MSTQLNALRELTQIPVLSALTEQEVFDFVRAFEFRKVAENEILFEEGDTCRSMFIIGEGRVEVRIKTAHGHEVVARMGEKDVVGELSLIDAVPRSATAIATSAGMVYEIRSADFDLLLEQGHPAAIKILRAVSQLVGRRIRSSNQRLEELLEQSAVSRSTSRSTSRSVSRPLSHSGDFAARRSRSQSMDQPLPPGRSVSISGDFPTVEEAQQARCSASSSISNSGAYPTVEPERPAGVLRSLISKVWGK